MIVSDLRWIIADWLLSLFLKVAPPDEDRNSFLRAIYPWMNARDQAAKKWIATRKKSGLGR